MTPTCVIAVRHGESTGNVAREAAEAERAELISIDQRDPDVPLSPRGEEQAAAVGRWLAGLPDGEPAVVWSSPYVRARQTAQIALATAGLDRRIRVDERLRDRELGVLDLLTGRGVTARFPEEAQRRRWLGKLYYRPPGGESWSDVALRLRSFLADLERAEGTGGTVLVVCHDAVIMLLRYVLEGLEEAELLELARTTMVGNGSVSRFERVDGRWRVAAFNEQDHLRAEGAPTTEHGRETDDARH